MANQYTGTLTMKFQRRAFVLLLSLALTAGNVLAQDTPANSGDSPNLTMFFLVVGLFALLGIGLASGSKSSANDSSD
jgi:hypothetical protein